MDEPTQALRFGALRKAALGVLVLLLVGVAALLQELDRRQVERNRTEPLMVLEAPVRASIAGQDRIYLLTSQVEHPLVWRYLMGGRWRSVDAGRSMVNIDLWALDAGDLKPVWRSRISHKEQSNLRDAALLGIDGDTAWVHAGQPLALSVRDGALLADAAMLVERNPGLAGLLPDEARYFQMDAAGAWLLDAQARHWRIDGTGFKAMPVDRSKPAMRNPRVVLPATVGAGQMLSYTQQRGVDLGDRWLGMFSAAEMETLQARFQTARHGEGAATRLMAANDASGSLREPGASGQRRRLWQAQRRMVSAAPEGWNDPMPDGSPSILPDNWGQKAEYSNFAPLPESGEYLDGGLLALETYRGHPLMLRQPDSVLVLHRDRMGEHGQYRLARVAGPAGRQLWNAKLPLTNLNAILPGTDSLVLLGRWFQTDEHVRRQHEQARKANPGPWIWRWLDEDPGAEHRDGYHDAAEHLVAIDHATGRLGTFDMTGPLREFPASPASGQPVAE